MHEGILLKQSQKGAAKSAQHHEHQRKLWMSAQSPACTPKQFWISCCQSFRALSTWNYYKRQRGSSLWTAYLIQPYQLSYTLYTAIDETETENRHLCNYTQEIWSVMEVRFLMERPSFVCPSVLSHPDRLTPLATTLTRWSIDNTTSSRLTVLIFFRGIWEDNEISVLHLLIAGY